MFTIDDLWNLIKYFEQGTSDSSLSELTTTLATSEKITVIELFERVLDQNTFSSDDYRRLRNMIIDWYTTHKTIATTQKFASDVHQMPNDHLSELFKSFGFGLLYLHTLVLGSPNPINPVTWSLETESQFYILIPILLMGLFYFGKKGFYGLFTLLILGSIFIKNYSMNAGNPHLFYFIGVYLINFSVGILIAYLLDYYKYHK